tara:strand:+ start:501 stop:1424 length:924 start_codon:yes stop_codon:yes gene_type:complete
MNKKKILIIGGTGFLGFHLCKFFLKKKWQVLSLSQTPPPKERKLKNIKYLFGDISKPKKIKFLNNLNYQYLINCGGYVDHYNKVKTYNTHVKGCKNIYNISLKKKLKAFIQIGSASEYGSNVSPHKESIVGKPKDNYGKNKLEVTNFFQNLENPFPFIVLRPYQIYGPYQDNNRLIPFIINSCLRNKKFPCSSGKQLRDFLYIDDFVSAVYKVIDKKNCHGKIFNVGYGKPTKVRKVIEIIHKKIKLGKPDYGKILLRKNESSQLFPSIKKTSKYVNWFPRVKLDKGLNKTIKYYKNFKNFYDHNKK